MRRAQCSPALLSAGFLLGVLIALAACSKVSTLAGHPSGGGNPWTHHGVLRMGEIYDPDNLNPVVGQQQVDVDVSMFWAGYLFNWSDKNKWVPELATRVPSLENGDISKDGLSIIYHLRSGVRWQDGARFGADDVIFTWQQVMNPNNNVGSRIGYDDIARIDRRDDHTLVVRLRHRYAPFVATFFTMSSTPYPVLPKHLLAGLSDINRAPYNRLPIGTGPFRMVEYHKSSLIKFVANPDYWRGPPKLKAIEYRIIPNDTTILTQLRTHEVDFEYAAAQAQAPSLGSIPGTTMTLTPFTSFAMVAFNVQRPILADPRVRQALTYGTDRKAIIDKVAHGIPIPGDTDQPALSWAHNANVRKYPYDPQAAAALLDAAGWRLAADGIRSKAGQRLELQAAGTAGDANSDEIFTLLQAQWRAVGADLTLKNYAGSMLLAPLQDGGIVQNGKFDIALFSWINGVDPDDSVFTMCDQWPPQGQNTFRYCNPKLDALERVALSTYDQPARKKAYDAIQAILAQDQPFIIVWFGRRIDVFNTDFRNYKPAHAVTQLWNTWEWEI